MFTYELARRLEGTGVTATVCHPGVVRTSFGAEDQAAHMAGIIPGGAPVHEDPGPGRGHPGLPRLLARGREASPAAITPTANPRPPARPPTAPQPPPGCGRPAPGRPDRNPHSAAAQTSGSLKPARWFTSAIDQLICVPRLASGEQQRSAQNDLLRAGGSDRVRTAAGPLAARPCPGGLGGDVVVGGRAASSLHSGCDGGGFEAP